MVSIKLPQIKWARYPKMFLRVLLNNVQNSTIAHQSKFLKEQNNEFDKIKNDLFQLIDKRTHTIQEFNKIFDLERQLTILEDKQIIRDFENFKYFNVLNMEKPSKQYSQLLKNSKKGQSLTLVKDLEGNGFNNDNDRENFITNHFVSLQ